MPPSPRRYPKHLYTLEFTLDDPRLPVLFHHFPSESAARDALRTAQAIMNHARGSFARLAIHHGGRLLTAVEPSALPAPKPLPTPDANGVRHLPLRGQRRGFDRFVNPRELGI